MTGKEIIGTNDLCFLFGVTRPTVLRWVKMGMPKISRGRFDIRAVIQWRLHNMKTRALCKCPTCGSPHLKARYRN